MIGNDEVDCAPSQRRPKFLLILRIANRRRAFELRPAISDRARSKKQIVRARFRRDAQAFFFRAANQRHRKLRGKMDDMNPRFEFAREANEHFDGFGFRAGRA